MHLQNPGGVLTVTVSGTKDKVENLYLEGPANMISVYEEQSF